ncbi:MAG TPA: hypothetical protein ENH85_15060 [Candidatus Scalindua sp.]|nr:hypothetical protein [Candidatus Scalindua sp.]
MDIIEVIHPGDARIVCCNKNSNP